jgi:hypothetical protein
MTGATNAKRRSNNGPLREAAMIPHDRDSRSRKHWFRAPLYLALAGHLLMLAVAGLLICWSATPMTEVIWVR